ncbi:MAG: hypothetical protein ACLRPD_03730 [Megamonas funiformis]|uniref:gp53-like domain-containing protein n=1 Tax=Megamonas funiformis TaxID=437897 RepID=UPI003990844A
MSELDFQKIFASGASSQIDWTDDNYLKGWGYLGNVPPSYQSFDYLQRLNDLKFKYLYDEFMGIETNTEDLISNHNENSEAHKTLFDKKLDKNGGTVTGNLNASGYNITATKFIGNLQGKADSAANADLAKKANQDSQGQTINTTYIKGVTGSNATLTVTKGNGTTSTVTVNNVANATNANVVTEKAITGNTLASALPVGMTWSKVYNNGFPCAYGNCLSIRGAGAIQIVTEWSGGDATPANMYYRNARDGSIDKWSAWRTLAHTGGTISNATTASKLGTGTVGSGVKPIYLNAGSPAASGSTVGSANRPIYMNGGTLSQCSIDLSTLAPKASPALTGSPTAPTQGTSDNSTKIATTAFVRNLINQFKTDGTLGGIVGGSLTQNGWVKFSNGLILQWGNNNGQGSYSRKVYSFPVAYSSAVYMMSANPKGNVGTGATKNAHSANVESLTQFSISVGEHSSMFWFSIGK